MTNRAAALVEAERLLGLTRKAYNEGHDNIAETEKRGGKLFEASMDTCPWENWMERGNYSYFVSRILLSQRIYLYGRFCAHQMIEAYIKAFLKFKMPKFQSFTAWRSFYPKPKKLIEMDRVSFTLKRQRQHASYSSPSMKSHDIRFR